VSQNGPTDTPAAGGLSNVLGVAFGLAGSVGGTIGAGILRNPGLVAAQLPSAGLIMTTWLVGGVYALLGAICIAELAAALPRAGGWTVYAEEAFGRRAGLAVGWCDWIAHCIGLAWVSTTLGAFLSSLIPINSPTLAVGVIVLFSSIQLFGVRAGGTSQELLSLGKAAALLTLVAACFLVPSVGGLAEPVSPEPTALPSGPALLVPIVMALQAVITTYDGWASPVYFAEEFKEPAQDLPRSLIGGVFVVLALYLLINAALLHVLPLPVLASAQIPAADAAEIVLGEWGHSVITVVAVLALLGLINTVVMAAPRILYRMGLAGLRPISLTQVSEGGTPVPALLITAGTSSLLVLAGTFEHLLAIGAVLYVALPLSGLAALATLRRQKPDLARPFCCWGYPFTPLLVGTVSLAFLIAAAISEPSDCLIALGLTALGGLLKPQDRTTA
jgi:APA family basic amino acid/polyamine antiporter